MTAAPPAAPVRPARWSPTTRSSCCRRAPSWPWPCPAASTPPWRRRAARRAACAPSASPWRCGRATASGSATAAAARSTRWRTPGAWPRRIGIPHYSWNLEPEFQREVVAPFADEYAAGRTPNPCVRCNETIKFGALLDRARAAGATHVATGHYARIGRRGAPRLAASRARRRPRTRRTRSTGSTRASCSPRCSRSEPRPSKEAVRREAAELGLVTAAKPDSQELCFVDGSIRADLERAAGGPIPAGPDHRRRRARSSGSTAACPSTPSASAPGSGIAPSAARRGAAVRPRGRRRQPTPSPSGPAQRAGAQPACASRTRHWIDAARRTPAPRCRCSFARTPRPATVTVVALRSRTPSSCAAIRRSARSRPARPACCTTATRWSAAAPWWRRDPGGAAAADPGQVAVGVLGGRRRSADRLGVAPSWRAARTTGSTTSGRSAACSSSPGSSASAPSPTERGWVHGTRASPSRCSDVRLDPVAAGGIILVLLGLTLTLLFERVVDEDDAPASAGPSRRSRTTTRSERRAGARRAVYNAADVRRRQPPPDRGAFSASVCPRCRSPATDGWREHRGVLRTRRSHRRGRARRGARPLDADRAARRPGRRRAGGRPARSPPARTSSGSSRWWRRRRACSRVAAALRRFGYAPLLADIPGRAAGWPLSAAVAGGIGVLLLWTTATRIDDTAHSAGRRPGPAHRPPLPHPDQPRRRRRPRASSRSAVR